MKRLNQPSAKEKPLSTVASNTTTNARQFLTNERSIADILPKSVYYGGCLAIVVLVVAAIYFVYRFIRWYRLYMNVEVVVALTHPAIPTVGETVSCRIRFKKKGGGIIPCFSDDFRELEENIIIEPHNDAVKRTIAVLHEVNKKNHYITGKFSARKSGGYEMHVKYRMFFYLTPETPLIFDVTPGSVCPKHVEFETHNPFILSLTAGIYQYFKILTMDEYRNKCRVEDVDLGKFGFQLFHMGDRLPVEHEFCHYTPTTSMSENSGTCNDASLVDVYLKVKVKYPGLYTCLLKYGDYKVHDIQEVPKLLVCLSSDEETELKDVFSSYNVPGILVYTSECKLSFLGDEDGLKDFCVGVSSTSLVFAMYKIPLMLYPDASFPINRRTKITHTGGQTSGSDNDNFILLVQDGLRRSVRLQMQSAQGRKFIAIFANKQGFLLPKSKMSFQEKKQNLKSQLSSYLDWFRFNSEKLLRIQQGNLVRSTKKEIPTHPDDWLLPFRIDYEGCPATTTFGVQQWLNRLCDEFFKGHGESSMFRKLPSSKLLHPVSSTVSQQPLENYRLAGKILAKAIVETLLRGICTHLSQIRFTRSLLAFILGYPINFKFLEADEPLYFKRIMSIVDSELKGNEYYFTTQPSSTSETYIVNLIPNGSDIPVTNANKEHYLNLLTNYRLIHTVEQEITAFRDGFFHVIDKDKLSDFQEQDLEQLISGGCAFNIEDLKAHHRVVKEVENGILSAIRRQSMDTKKVMSWFWTAVENFSEEEQSNLIFFSTGSYSLPSCGLVDLNPVFTISLTGTFNQPPKAHPTSNEIVLGDHVCFENFERSLLYAIKPEAERILLPTSDEIHIQQSFNSGNYEEVQIEFEEGEGTEQTDSPRREAQGTSEGEIFLTWLREMINL